MSTILSHPVLFIGCAALLGLWAGAWVARCVYALPRALEATWQHQLAQAQSEAEAEAAGQAHAQLFSQPSMPRLTAPVPCPACGSVARGWRHWPGVSAVAAPLVCRSCGEPREGYTRLIEFSCAVVFALCAWRYGWGVPLAFALILCALLIALAFIDAQTTLLPDVMTLPLLWLGLLVNSGQGWTPLSHAVWGAALGYGGLWLVYHAFRLVTGREGMGYGDFKLLAALGAWFGVLMLPWILLGASLAGVVAGLALRFTGRAQAEQALPFGPYLSAAGIIALIWFVEFPG